MVIIVNKISFLLTINILGLSKENIIIINPAVNNEDIIIRINWIIKENYLDGTEKPKVGVYGKNSVCSINVLFYFVV